LGHFGGLGLLGFCCNEVFFFFFFFFFVLFARERVLGFLFVFHVGHFLFLFLFLVVCIQETESMTSAEQLVLELIVPEQRENALLDLSKVRLLFCTPVCVCVCVCVCMFVCFLFFLILSPALGEGSSFLHKLVLRTRSWCAQERERNGCPKLSIGFYIPVKETVLMDCCQNLEKLCYGFMTSCACLW
jgi:hypothetical protein